MIRVMMLLFLLIPALALAAPVPRVKEKVKPVVPDLTGTSWSGDGVVTTPTAYRFAANGVLEWSHGKTTYLRGTWKQEGRRSTGR